MTVRSNVAMQLFFATTFFQETTKYLPLELFLKRIHKVQHWLRRRENFNTAAEPDAKFTALTKPLKVSSVIPWVNFCGGNPHSGNVPDEISTVFNHKSCVQP